MLLTATKNFSKLHKQYIIYIIENGVYLISDCPTKVLAHKITYYNRHKICTHAIATNMLMFYTAFISSYVCMLSVVCQKHRLGIQQQWPGYRYPSGPGPTAGMRKANNNNSTTNTHIHINIFIYIYAWLGGNLRFRRSVPPAVLPLKVPLVRPITPSPTLFWALAARTHIQQLLLHVLCVANPFAAKPKC